LNLQAQAVNVQNEKRQRQFDKLVEEWKRKVADLQIELENAQKESRSNAADSYKSKAQLEEVQETIEALRRENKNLSGNFVSVSTCYKYLLKLIRRLGYSSGHTYSNSRIGERYHKNLGRWGSIWH